jgi:hypothetical protein
LREADLAAIDWDCHPLVLGIVQHQSAWRLMPICVLHRFACVRQRRDALRGVH